MTAALIFNNARLVLPGEVVAGSLVVQGSQIAAMTDTPSSGANSLDLQGDYLLPGLVEVHTDNFERHLMPRPKVHWPVLPALLAHDAEIVAAGITTVLDALGVGDADSEADSLRGGSWQEVLQTLDYCTQQNLLRAEHHLHIRCELPAANTIDLFAPFHGHPRLAMISLMDHTPGQRQWGNIEHARTYFTGKKGWSLDKFERQLAQAAELQARYANPHRSYFVDYCRQLGIALASHDDTTMAHVQEASSDGVNIVEFPTTLAAAQMARELRLSTVMGAPNVMRGGSHSGNVAASELARHGLLDILSSDYVPASLLTAAMRLYQDGLTSLPQAIAMISLQPARAVGLHDRGALQIGLRADLLQVRMVSSPNGSTHAVVRAVWRGGERVL
ncbi:alpha-D-ribose 1-methylphosphonate 5-triphosphate diphosphatase [Neisseriaceae bacterium TC5R-5]|nr:alpha-D-ribose 1-methylphosphonate 5-triphosphate diphosphatase [Neisseriaceae bacterium TC5R-5]